MSTVGVMQADSRSEHSFRKPQPGFWYSLFQKYQNRQYLNLCLSI